MADACPKSNSLKSYLNKSQSYLSILILAVCVIGMTLIAAHTFKKYSEHNLQLIAHAFAEQIQLAVVIDDPATVQDTIHRFMQKYPLQSIIIWDTQHHLLASSASEQSIAQNNMWITRLQQWLIADDAGYTTITHNAQPVAIVEMKTTITPLLQFLKQFILFFLISLCCIVCIIRISTFLMYRNINQSLAALIDTTEAAIEQRDFNQRIPASKITEFNVIAMRFNTLLDEIQLWQQDIVQENSHLEYRALHDVLTELPNRAYFNQRLKQLFNTNSPSIPFALLYIDNNRFKAINDTHGHHVGDLVLQTMAMRLKNTLRMNDFIARIGGDEFAVILQNVSTSYQALSVAKHLIEASQEPLIYAGQQIYFGFSIGIALSKDSQNMQELIQHADQAMYIAKQKQPSIALYK